MVAGWTVNADLIKFNRSIDKYVKRYNVDFGKFVKFISIGLVKDIAQSNPVDTGRSRAAWLPFLWSLNVSVPLTQSKTATTKHKPGALLSAKREGVAKGKYKHKFEGTSQPYAWVQNNVHYVKYLEYGTRRGGGGGFSAVARSGTKGFVRGAIKKWHMAIKASLKSGRKLRGM